MKKCLTVEELFSEIILDPYDNLYNSFLKDQNSFFNKNELLSIFYKDLQKTIKDWKNSRQCIYRNCQNISIKSSHSITKGMFLSTISENNHVYTPAPDYNTSATKVKKVGINIASTFPGFCSEHEKLFFDFEMSGKFNSELDIFKQIYRTICREIIIKEFRLKTLQEQQNSYKKYRDEKLLVEIKKQPNIKLFEHGDKKIKSITYEGSNGDPVLNSYQSEIEDLKKDIEDFKKAFYDRIHDDIELKTNESNFYCLNIAIEQKLPIALAGRVNVEITEQRNGISVNTRNIDLILNVLPTLNDTNIFIFSASENENFINKYLDGFTKHEFGIIEMIESWMVHGSDHWFIQPSIWEKISKENQNAIINDIVHTKNNIGSVYNKTIFNDLKRELFFEIKKSKDVKDYQRILKIEKSKFTD